jgi:hypothetical protein
MIEPRVDQGPGDYPCLADIHRAQPVYHRDAADGVLTCDFAADFGHFPDCNRFVATLQ